MFVLGLIIGGTVGLVIYAACCVARRSENQSNNNPKVVRCKDCRHWGGVPFGYVCRRFSGTYIRNETKENDFCSYGELKERDTK